MPPSSTTFPFAIPDRLIGRLPAASHDGYVYVDVLVDSNWDGILAIDAMHRCVGAYVGRRIVEIPLPFAPAAIEDVRPPCVRNRLLALLPASLDPFAAGVLLLLIGCPAVLPLLWLSRGFAVLLPAFALTGIWLLYQIRAFIFIRCLLLFLGLGWSAAGVMLLV